MSKKSKILLLIFFGFVTLIIALLLFLSNNFTEKKSLVKTQKKKLINKNFYQLIIESPKEFTAIVTTRQYSGIIDDTLNLLYVDSVKTKYRRWQIKIINKEDVYLDTSISVTSQNQLNSSLIQVFSLIPYKAPQNAKFEYKNNEFIPIEAVDGNKLNLAFLTKNILQSIKSRKENLLVNNEIYYIKPLFKLSSLETQLALKNLKKCLMSCITFTLKNDPVTLTKKEFANWLTLDSTMHVSVNNTKALNYICSMANKNDIVVNNITFTTAMGNNKTVYGGDLGYRINIYKELSLICKDIKNGLVISREPIYGMRGIPNGVFDTNKTYIEINISEQKLWYYNSGNLILESDIVTGNTSNGNSTPNGAYYLKYKERNATLNGPGYSTSVRYWMPFNAGIGMHDASWRSSFGGNIYKTNGSHGCINLPFNSAQTIFNNINDGTIVICYTN